MHYCDVDLVSKIDLTAALERVVVMLENLGYTSLKPEHENAIKKFVKGHDVFVCLPIAFGKSLCYIPLSMLFYILKGHTSPYSIVHTDGSLDAIPSEIIDKKINTAVI